MKREYNISGGYSYRAATGRYVSAAAFRAEVARLHKAASDRVEALRKAIEAEMERMEKATRALQAAMHEGGEKRIRTWPTKAAQRAYRNAGLFGTITRRAR